MAGSTRWGRYGTPPSVSPQGSGFTPAVFNAAFPSAWWLHTFIPVGVMNNQPTRFGESIFAQSPNNNEYLNTAFPQNLETTNWSTAYWCAPFNWDTSAGLKCRAYWYVTAEGSHGTPVEWEWSIRAIGNAETMRYNQVYTLNADTETANDLIYITDELSYTPYTDGSALAVNDFFHIMFRRQNDGASGSARLLGLRLAWKIDPTIAVP